MLGRIIRKFDHQPIEVGTVWRGHEAPLTVRVDVVCAAVDPDRYEGRVSVGGMLVHSVSAESVDGAQRLGSEWFRQRLAVVLED
ncbi:hypothetical protein ACTVCO_10125 [Sanguibacter sp. A247]|uniref:hypothetical protein n=1 Tax=unclassified Sanguibacter TaxID=2645534 RepID=UPI003FD7EF78